MITRRGLLQVGAAALVAGRSHAAPRTRRPSFIVICADDLGYGDLGCFGSPTIRTPVLDGLAQQGLKLTCAYAEPFCGPARAALMTGCHPMRIAEPGNRKNRHTVLHAEEVTLAEVLGAVGYRSAMIGKWGLGGHSNNRYRPELLPSHQGFDLHFGTPASNDFPEDVVLLRDGDVVERPARLETLTERYFDEAIRFVRAQRGGPFLVYLCPNMPHVALAVAESFRGRSTRGLYGDAVEEIDFHVGRLVRELERAGLEEHTYLVFTSDNGPWIEKREFGGSAGPLRGAKGSVWEGGFRVPTIAWAPGRIDAGRVYTAPIALQDVLPTFASLAGASLPAGRVIDGRDMRAVLAQRDPPVVRDGYDYYLWTHLQAVRRGRWKLLLPRPKDPPWLKPLEMSRYVDPEDSAEIVSPLLFDLEADPGERYDLAAAQPEVVRALLAEAEAVRRELGDHDRIGAGVRFFDAAPERPQAPLPP